MLADALIVIGPVSADAETLMDSSPLTVRNGPFLVSVCTVVKVVLVMRLMSCG